MYRKYSLNKSIGGEEARFFVKEASDAEQINGLVQNSKLSKKMRSKSANYDDPKKINTNDRTLSVDNFELPDYVSVNDGNGAVNIDKKNIIWSSENPWLSTHPEFGYVPLKKKGNMGFYWLWKSNTIRAPTITHLIGGPGRSVLKKAFGGYNPLNVDKKTNKLVYNQFSAINKYNLLYIESPIGSGYSVTTRETQTKNLDELNESLEEIIEYLMKKHPSQRGCSSYMVGDGYCGQTLPHIAEYLMKSLNLSIKGIFLENPIIHPNQEKLISAFRTACDNITNSSLQNPDQSDMDKEVEKMQEKDVKKGCGLPGFMNHKSSNNGCGFFGQTNLIDSWKKKSNNRKIINSYEEKQILAKKKYSKGRKVGRREINDLISSSNFRNLVSKKKCLDQNDMEKYVDFDYYNKKLSSIDPIVDIINMDINVIFISGCKDYVYPDWSLEDSLKKCDFSFRDSFLNAQWNKYGDFAEIKCEKNVQWIKHKTAGHCLFAEYPNWLSRTIIDCIYEIEEKGGVVAEDNPKMTSLLNHQGSFAISDDPLDYSYDDRRRINMNKFYNDITCDVKEDDSGKSKSIK